MGDDPSGSRQIAFQVSGMTCMMCVKHVTNALEKVPGIQGVQVTLTPPRAVVRYDPTRTSPGAMIEAVRAAGYDARE